jgi:hypothetical protein
VINNSLIVGDCTQEGLGKEANYMLFKSKPFRYAVFDWSSEYLKLPERPIALTSYAGKVYAFSQANTYVINPDGFFVEDHFLGIGCFSDQSYYASEVGLFWADKNNAYAIMGGKFQIISNNIKSKTGYWHGWTSDTTLAVAYNVKRNAVLFGTNNSAYQGRAWSYSLDSGRWDALELKVNYFTNFIVVNPTQEIYAIGSNGASWLYGNSSSREDWSWESKVIDFGSQAEEKFIYKVEVVGTNYAILAKYNDENYSALASGQSIKAPGNKWMQINKLQLKLSSTSTTAESNVKDIRILFRRKRGLR